VSDENSPLEDRQTAANDGSQKMSSSLNAENFDTGIRAHLFECRSCGYVYDPKDGVKKFEIAPGTAFMDLDRNTFRCPVCRLGIDSFRDIGPKSKPSGFEENLNYGFGINNLTSGQKNVLIFGGLAFAIACFLSLYSLH